MKKKFKYILVFFILFVFLVVFENFTVGTTNISILSENLPKGFDNFKIAHISDLHNAQFGKENKQIFEILENEKPDIIAITGDLIDANKTNMDIAVQFAKNVMKIAPCYYVTGNHEAWINDKYYELEKYLIECGIKVLHDEYVIIEKGNSKIKIAGIDDVAFFQDIYSLTEKIQDFGIDKDKTYTILLSHRPEYFENYVESNVDLVLTGHAHGGQFRLPFVGGIVAPNQGLFPEYDAGVFEKNNTKMIVSRGIGNSIIPVRINNRPEVVIVKLEVD